ncbi:uncharacterized protein LOC109859552, partial [Pseudomyrmex gracilis]|uniref:uncharacterized protein LOC109859552 n=1 Tax=Pseudomyrmex gracilis TaxID=219809 RepID=UPI0009953E97
MAVPRTTSTFRPDGGGGGDDGSRQSRRRNSQIGVRIGRRSSKRSSSIEVTAKQAGPAGKFLLIGAVLAIQFVGAAAAMRTSFPNRGNDINVDFYMPNEAVVNATIELRCHWKILGGSRLYSVKLYKDDHEVYQYLLDNEKTQTFHRPGVNIKEQQE